MAVDDLPPLYKRERIVDSCQFLRSDLAGLNQVVALEDIGDDLGPRRQVVAASSHCWNTKGAQDKKQTICAQAHAMQDEALFDRRFFHGRFVENSQSTLLKDPRHCMPKRISPKGKKRTRLCPP